MPEPLSLSDCSLQAAHCTSENNQPTQPILILEISGVTVLVTNATCPFLLLSTLGNNIHSGPAVSDS